MTPQDAETISTLRWFADAQDKWMNRPGPVSAAAAGALVRRGFLRSTTQSERVRGERRTTWSMYKITPAGRAALTGASSDVNKAR